MFVCHSGSAWAAVLLLVLALNSVHAFFSDGDKKVKALSVEKIIGSMQVPWLNGIDSFTRSSETLCADETAAFLAALAAQQTWAMNMLDASSKIQSGILVGNIQNLGSYDQCIAVDGKYNETNVRGQYCMVSFSGLTSSLCMPSSCNETEVGEIISSAVQNVNGTEIEMAVTCPKAVSGAFSRGEILAIVFFATVVAFTTSCTICDLVRRNRSRESSATVDLLAKFSLYTNAITIMSTKVTPQLMPAIQGIRCLSLCWIVLGHRFMTVIYMPMVNKLDILPWFNSWSGVYIQTATYAVDTFFVVSGFLISYLFLKATQSGKRPNFLMMYVHRYLRLTPCVAVMMLFVAVLYHRVSNGPIWESSLQGEIENCRKNWWINLCYVQNFVNASTICLGQTWYLAVDMQLFWISPIILYPLSRWPKLGLIPLGCFLIVSVATPPVVAAINGYSTAILRFDIGNIKRLMDNFSYFYIRTYNRACAYFVGMLLGYDVANRKRHLTRINVAVNWVVALIFLLLCGLATHFSCSTDFDYNQTVENLFALFLRPFWSIAIAWMAYACTQGYGGFLTRFLSLPIFLPLSRLSYCIYLVHQTIQMAKSASVRTPDRFSDFTMLTVYWGDLGLSIAVAFILSLFIESPVIILEKIVTNRSRAGREQLPPTQRPKKDEELGTINNKAQTADT